MKIDFRKALIISMAIITALSVSVACALNYFSFSKIFKTELHDEIQTKIDNERATLNDFITIKSRSVAAIANEFSDLNHQINYVDIMHIAALSGDLENLTIGFSNGDAYCSADLPGWTDHKNPARYDPRQRPWFSQAMHAPGLIYTKPYHDANTNELMFSIGKKAGANAVVLADIPLGSLDKAIDGFDSQDPIPSSLIRIIQYWPHPPLPMYCRLEQVPKMIPLSSR